MLRDARLIAALVGTLLLASLGMADRTVVTVWGMAITPDEKGNDVLVRAFEAENPDIKIRLLGMGAGGMNPQKLMTAIVGGTPPDLVRQDRFTIADWASRGAFRPLDDLLQRDSATDPRCPKPGQYYKAAWEEARYQGQTFGVPIGADDRVLYYNLKVFREKADALRRAGLDPERPPRTWSETLAYSRALTEFNPDGSIKRAGFMPNYGNSWLYLYAFQNNASLMSDDGTRCTMDSPEVLEALNFMVTGYTILGGYEKARIFERGFGNGDDHPLATGRVAMFTTGDWEIANFARQCPNARFATAPSPVPDDRFFKRGRFSAEKDTFVTWSGGFAWSMPKGAKNVEAAWRFLKWITCLEGRQMSSNAQADVEKARGRKYIPRMEAHIGANEWMVDKFAAGDDQYSKALRTHASLMPYARMRPATFVGQKLWDEHVRALEDAASGGKTPEAALKYGSGQVNALLREFLDRDRFPKVNVPVPVGIAFLAAALGLFVWMANCFRSGAERVSKSETKAGFAFVSPWIIGFAAFTLGPMVASLCFSFMQYDVLNEARFVGFNNFHDVFVTDREVLWKAFENVGYLALIGIPLGTATGLAIAMLLNTGVRFMRAYRTAFYLPSITPGVASAFLWVWLLNPDTSRGLVNNAWAVTIGNWFAVPPPGWLNVEAWAKPSLILMGLWGAGGGMIFWLAGLKGIPGSLYEAASIDGASPWKQFLRVTLPQLSPLLFFQAIMGIIGALQTFDSVYVVTGGQNMGPNASLSTPVYVLFNNGFSYFRMGYASALAWVIFVIVVLVTVLQFKVAPRWVHMESDK